MKEIRDTPRPTMSDEEMVKDYPRLKREYTLLHEEYRRLQSEKEKQLKLYDVGVMLPTDEDIKFEMDTNYDYGIGMEGTYEEGKYVGFEYGADFVIEHIKKQIKGN